MTSPNNKSLKSLLSQLYSVYIQKTSLEVFFLFFVSSCVGVPNNERTCIVGYAPKSVPQAYCNIMSLFLKALFFENCL